jgi:hypothetical protein
LGKKRTRPKKVSRGLRKNVARTTNHWSLAQRLIFKAEARAKGKRVCETIANPDKTDLSRLFIRVCTSGKVSRNG